MDTNNPQASQQSQTPVTPDPMPPAPSPSITSSELPQEPPAVPPPVVHSSSSPLILTAIVVVALLIAGIAVAGYMIMQSPQEPAAQTTTTVQPTVINNPEVLPTTEPESTAASELEQQAIPQTGAEIDTEIEILDSTVDDGSERNFEGTTLDEVEQ